jgi:ribosomal protein L16 Arg81 hydroxylase
LKCQVNIISITQAYEFFKKLKNDKNHYYFSRNFNDIPNDLKNDIHPTDYFKIPQSSDIDHSINIWIGANSTTHCHYDPTENFFIQFFGKKR